MLQRQPYIVKGIQNTQSFNARCGTLCLTMSRQPRVMLLEGAYPKERIPKCNDKIHRGNQRGVCSDKPEHMKVITLIRWQLPASGYADKWDIGSGSINSRGMFREACSTRSQSDGSLPFDFR